MKKRVLIQGAYRRTPGAKSRLVGLVAELPPLLQPLRSAERGSLGQRGPQPWVSPPARRVGAELGQGRGSKNWFLRLCPAYLVRFLAVHVCGGRFLPARETLYLTDAASDRPSDLPAAGPSSFRCPVSAPFSPAVLYARGVGHVCRETCYL